jgi:hypothetical protein
MRAVVLACAMPLVLACGAPGVVERTRSYHAEVHDAVGGDAALRAYERGERFYPPLRERVLEVMDERIGMLDFLAIQGCRLGELAGYRNSPLGRVMVPTRRLAHEIELLDAAVDCLPRIEDPERRTRLEALLVRKRAELPRHVWNAIWTDEGLERYLATERLPEAGRWSVYASHSLVEVGQHLDPAPRSVADVRALESSLGELRGAHPAGGLLRALDEVGHHLDAVSVLLEGSGTDDCTPTRRRLVRVFQRSYVHLQPELARIDRRGREVVEALSSVLAASARGSEVPVAMQRYRERLEPGGDHSLRSRYRRAIRRHAESWQPTLHQCSVKPWA